MKMKTTGMMAALSLCALAGVAQATDELHLDINHMTVQAATAATGGTTQAFSLAGSGFLQFSFDGTVLDIDEILDKHGAATFVDWGTQAAFSNVTGHVEYSGDDIVGGEVTVTVGGATYTADISSEVDAIEFDSILGWYKFSAHTFAGLFSTGAFGTVPAATVAKYEAGEPLFGRLFQFKYNPTAAGLDKDVQMEIWVTVPLPPAAYAGLGMLAGVMGLSYVLRRR